MANLGNGVWSDELFDWFGHFSPAFVAPNPAMTVTPIFLDPVRPTLTFTAPEPTMSVTAVFSEPLRFTSDFETPEPELSVTITFAGENALTAEFTAPDPHLDVVFGENGPAYDTADFVAPEPELTVEVLYSTPWTAPAIEFDVPEPEMAVSEVVFLEIVYLPDAEFVVPNPTLAVTADVNMALMEDLFNPSEVEIELDVFLTFEIPYATPPGGLYETDGTEILAPDLAWVPEV